MNTAPAMLASVSLAVSILQSNENTSMETTNQTDIVRNFLYIYLLFYLFPAPPSRAVPCAQPGVSRPWDAQPHIFMARGLAAFSRMFVQFFIFSPTRALDAGSPIVSLACILAFVFCPSMSKSYFPKSTPGGLLAFGFALREPVLCPARYRTERPHGLARHAQG